MATILVIDDEDSIRHLLKDALEKVNTGCSKPATVVID